MIKSIIQNSLYGVVLIHTRNKFSNIAFWLFNEQLMECGLLGHPMAHVP